MAAGTREFLPVGGREIIRVDVRILCATHRNLKDMVEEGTFREDLYYRLVVGRIEVPPLRDRTEDIPLLAHHFASELGQSTFDLSAQLLEELRQHTWPGNVRELRNQVERMVIMSPGPVVSLSDLSAEMQSGVPAVAPGGATA